MAAGYLWSLETHSIGDAVISLRDGVDNVVWSVVIGLEPGIGAVAIRPMPTGPVPPVVATAKATIWRRWEAQLNAYRMHARQLSEEVTIRAAQEIPHFDPIEVPAADTARMVRMQWRMPIGPVRELVRWLEAAGCLVIMHDFGSRGCCIRAPCDVPCGCARAADGFAHRLCAGAGESLPGLAVAARR